MIQHLRRNRPEWMQKVPATILVLCEAIARKSTYRTLTTEYPPKGSSIILAKGLAMSDLDDWLSTDDAAKLSGFHPDHIRRLVRSKHVEARKWGNAWMIRRKSLSSYIAASKQRGKKRGPRKSADE